MSGKSSSVNFSAYCNAFKAIDAQVAERICYALDKTEGDWTPKMFRDEPGDGFVMVPSFSVIAGKEQVSEWRRLSEDGRVELIAGKAKYQEERIQSLFAKYFISGAFGVGELKNSEGMDSQIVDGLQQLYKICSRRGERCLESKEANVVSKNWGALQGKIVAQKESERLLKIKQIEEKRAFDAKMKDVKNLERFCKRLLSDESENGKVAMQIYTDSLPKQLKTMTDLQKAERVYTQMKAALWSLRVARVKSNRVDEVVRYEEMFNELAKTIKGEQPFGAWGKYTRALKKGLECMPEGRTQGERECVAENKYNMAESILSALRLINSNKCVRWETRRVEKKDFGFSVKSMDTYSHTTYEDERYCAERKYGELDFSRKKLIEDARRFCSTECH